MMKKTTLFVLFFSALLPGYSQNDSIVYYKNGAAETRKKRYDYTIQHSIHKNLSQPLNTQNEAAWEDAFYSIQLINYAPALVLNKINKTIPALHKRSIGFQLSFWTLCYKRFPVRFFTQAKKTMDTTANFKLMAICGEYILADEAKLKYAKNIFTRIEKLVKKDSLLSTNPFLIRLATNARLKMGFGLETPKERALNLLKFIPDFLNKSYLPDNVVVYSFQRKNRNYPGLVLVRAMDGHFIKNNDGTYFSVPQLARSINNLPGYLTNGNTPQGIFRMYGFDISKLEAIGVTQNIQLTLPVECTKQHFFKDTTILNNDWSISDYKNFLPKNWRGNFQVYEAYYAGFAGRNEIIAHGTTVNPQYYKGQSYYPLTPTAGCLCTKEIWSEADGKRVESDQQKLVNAVKKAGGADGYLILLELEDENKPVLLNDILPYLDQLK